MRLADDELSAYCLDEAVWAFGQWVEEEVSKAGESNGKQDSEKKRKVRMQRTFERCLGLKPRFRSIGKKGST